MPKGARQPTSASGGPARDAAGYFSLIDPQGRLCLCFRECELGRLESTARSIVARPSQDTVPQVMHLRILDGLSLHTALFHLPEAADYDFEITDEHVNLSYCLQGQSCTQVELECTAINSVIQTPANCTASFLPRAHGRWRAMKGPCRLLGLRLSVAKYEQLSRQLSGAAGRGNLPQADEPFFMGAPASSAIMMAARGLDQIINQGPRLELLLQCKALEMCIQILAQFHGLKTENFCKAIPLSHEDECNIHLASEILLRNMSDPPSLSRLARLAGVNEFKLKRGFRQVFGLTPFDFLRGARLDQAKRHLEDGRMNVCEACLAVGYSNQGHFCGAFKKRFGITPGGVRQSALRRFTGGNVEQVR